MKYFITGIVVLLCISACTHKSPKVILLRLKYVKHYHINIKYHNIIIAEDQENRPVTDENVGMKLTMDSVINDSLYAMSGTYNSLKIDNNDGIGSISNYWWERDKPYISNTRSVADQRFKPLLQPTYKFILNKRGKMVSPFRPVGSSSFPMELSLIDYGLYQIEFPTDSLGIGNAWINESQTPIRKHKRVAKYYIEDISEETIRINVSGTLTADNGLTNKFSGLYYLDRDNHTLDSLHIETLGKTFFHDKAKATTTITTY